METKNKTQDKEVSLDVNKVDMPKIDVSKYIGKKVMIENVKAFEGQYGQYVKIVTLPVDTIGKGDKAIELKGSKIFSLIRDANNVYGIGKGSKLDLFLEKMKCKDLKSLKGKEVILITHLSDNGTEFLTFN